MTNNTIPNVPRELLATALKADASIGASAIDLVAGWKAMAELRALLSAPSPAGVDWLEVVAWVVTGFLSPREIGRTRRAFVVTKADAETQHANWLPHYNRVTTEPLCRLSDAQAIIDGLRGENERIRLNIAEYNEAIACYQSERDQQAQRIGELEGLLLDTGAERNAMQRERDAYKLLLDRECNDADFIFMALGIAPDSIRTEGGFLMVAHLVSLISAKSEKLETLLHEAIPGLQHLSDTAQDIDTFTLVARVKSALSAGKDSDK